MTPAQEIRLEVLRLLKLPDIASPDVSKFIERAKALEAYVVGEGHATLPPRNAETQAQPQARTMPQSPAPARK